ncbi:MAG: hypothetical protein LDLANPLL_01814 [Turneriella sp.]|nr:hypothetical protein [Turneriella sp.]
MKIRNFLISERVIRDIGTNNISLINILENISAPRFPIAINQLFIYFQLAKTEDAEKDLQKIENIQMQIFMDSEIINESTVAFDFFGRESATGIMNVGGLLLKKPGTLRFQFSLEGKFTESCDVIVTQTA